MTASWWLKSKRRRSGATSDPACLHVRTEHLAQRPVQDVGRGVVAADAVAALAVDRARRPRRPPTSVPGSTIAAVQRRGPGAPYCVSSTSHARAAAVRRSRRCRRPGRPTPRRTACGRARRRRACPRPRSATRSPPPTSARTFAPAVSYSCRPVNSVGPSSSSSSRYSSTGAPSPSPPACAVRLAGARALLGHARLRSRRGRRRGRAPPRSRA